MQTRAPSDQTAPETPPPERAPEAAAVARPPAPPPWDEVLAGAPGAGRSLAEVGFFAAVLLAPPWILVGALALGANADGARLAAWGFAALAAVWGLALLRPWSLPRRLGRFGVPLAVLATAVLLATTWLTVAARPLLDPPPRIGIDQEAVAAQDGQGEVSRVTRIVPGSAADGHLEVGDRILAVAGVPLSSEHPAADLAARSRDAARLPAGETVFEVRRDGRLLEITLDLPAATEPKAGEVLTHTVLGDLGLLVFLFFLLLRDGEGPAAVGLVRRGAAREALFGVPALGLLLVAHLVFSVAVAAVVLSTVGLGEAEIASRAQTANLFTQSLAGSGLAVAVGVVFEEVLFRGFILVRLRRAFGRWAPALLASAVLFGLGHVYEGTLAAGQAAWIALVLGGIYLWRRHLASVVVAHAGFDVLSILAMLLLAKLGVL